MKMVSSDYTAVYIVLKQGLIIFEKIKRTILNRKNTTLKDISYIIIATNTIGRKTLRGEVQCKRCVNHNNFM
jgi:hypothetical protein